jgi:selenocysteine-specific elongation factor
MPIIGTAGHVDHGKSTLVQALTGRDPDRWAEEKERGLTIDLGFAWTELGKGAMVGFVDVPGHERFMKNMLAGVGALDVALFVVAADEGWMPQTEEHLSVLDLLDVRHGVIALTRTDLVDQDTAEFAELEIDERTQGTSLEGWPVVPVSPVTGHGLEELRSALVDTLESAGPPADSGRPRLWVDRSFVISGAGVVVTGTLTGGAMHRGDALVLHPGAHPTRIRGLQSHESDVDLVTPGTRTAVNLAGLEREQIARGAHLAAPGQVGTTRQFLADVRTVRSLEDGVTGRGAFHLHVGSGAWPVRLRPVSGDAIDGRGAALLYLDSALPLVMGDRFILREVGRRAVVAGGRVLEPGPTGRLQRVAAGVAGLRAAVDGTADIRAQALLDARGRSTLDALYVDSGGGRPDAALFSTEAAATVDEVKRMTEALRERLREYQQENPLRPGAPRASLVTGLGIAADLLDALVAADDEIVDDGATLRTRDFAGELGKREEEAWSSATTKLNAAGLAVPRVSQLGLDPELLHAVIRSGRLTPISDEVAYLPEQIEEILERLQRLEDGFTVADFRDALGVSRRHAVPLLEWLDAGGWTVRRGDARSLRKRPGREDSDARPQ